MTDFINVTVNVNGKKEAIKMEKGCSFENNGNIYRMNERGSLSVFDKNKRSWSQKNEITMTKYQFDVFKAVANNTQEKIDGKVSDEVILSSADINYALYESGEFNGLEKDLSEFVHETYKPSNISSFREKFAFAVDMIRGKNNKSATLVFKHGTADDAVDVSDTVHGLKSNTKTKTHKKTMKECIRDPKDARTDIPEFFEVSLKKLTKKLKLKNVDELKAKISKIAKQTGRSEYFIMHLMSVESFDAKPKRKGDGAITAGFGHTNLRDKSVTMKTRVDADIALKWLASDIKYFENIVKKIKINGDKTVGDYWDQMPNSLRESIIDVAFNRDVRKIGNSDEYASLRANLENGAEYLPAIAVRLRQDFSQYSFEQKLTHKFTPGLMLRNCYRFLLAIRDFNSEYTAAAKRRFENANNYYTETLNLQRHKGYKYEAKLLEKAWNSAV